MRNTIHRRRSLTPVSGRVSTAIALGVIAGLVLGASAAYAAGGVTIEKPLMRFIINDRPAGGYFTLRNDTDRSVKLTGASSAGCGMMMPHQSKQVNGVDKMLPVDSVMVQAHGTVSFAPGGYHLMCMSPQMKVGGTAPVILTFADGKTVSTDFPVKGPGG